MSKYRTIDWRPVVEQDAQSCLSHAWEVHPLFRMALENPGEIRFWKNDQGQEYCAVYDALMMEMHTDLPQ